MVNSMTGGRVRRRVAGLGAVALAFALTACGTPDPSAPTPQGPATSAGAPSGDAAQGADPGVVALLPAGIKDKGVLTVGMEAQYPPFEFYDTDNKTVIGFDADMAASLAKLMGLKLEINDAAFDSIIPSLASGRYDLGISGFTVTAERAEQVDFVTYYYEGDGLMVKAGNPSKLTIGDSLCGVKIAVLKGSTQALKSVPELDKGCTAAGKPAIAATVVPGSNDLGLALQSGRADAVLTDGSNAGYTAKLSAGKFEVATGQPYNPAPFGVASPKGNGMDKAVQKALEVMVSDGSYDAALKQWNMESGAVETPKINEISG
jgi:polar amino acid transport system substrate-binding protein